MGNGKKSKRQRYADDEESTADLSSTVNESVKDYFKNLIASMQLVFENKLSEIKADFLSKEHDLKVAQEKLEKDLAEEKRENIKLREQAKETKELTQTLLRRQCESEQYSRKNNIKIYGLRETGRRETALETTHLVLEFLNEKLGVRVGWQDICISHRLGNPEPHRCRSVIVKFVRRLTKLEVLENRYRLKGSGIVISEDLTPVNNKLFWELRDSLGQNNVWTRDCQIFVNTRGGPRNVNIANRREIEALALREPHASSTPARRHQPSRQGHQPLRGRGHHGQHGQQASHVPRPAAPGGAATAAGPPSGPAVRVGRGRASPRGRDNVQPPLPGIDNSQSGAWATPLRGFARGQRRYEDA